MRLDILYFLGHEVAQGARPFDEQLKGLLSVPPPKGEEPDEEAPKAENEKPEK